MANIFHITAGLPPARDGSPDTGGNIFHLTAGLPPEIVASGGDASLLVASGSLSLA